MHRVLSLFGVLLACAVASADAPPVVSFWMTDSQGGSVGINDANTFNNTEANFIPSVSGYATGAAAVATVYSGGMTTSKTLFLWGRFGDATPYSQIYGLRWSYGITGDLDVTQLAIYRQTKLDGPIVERYRRWYGPILPSGPGENGVLVAYGGLQYGQGIYFVQPGETSYDLCSPDDGTFLLGAFEVTGSVGDVSFAVVDTPGATGAGIAYKDGATETSLWDIPISVGASGDLPWSGTGGGIRSGVTARFDPIPEPATLLLAALGVLALRRR